MRFNYTSVPNSLLQTLLTSIIGILRTICIKARDCITKAYTTLNHSTIVLCFQNITVHGFMALAVFKFTFCSESASVTPSYFLIVILETEKPKYLLLSPSHDPDGPLPFIIPSQHCNAATSCVWGPVSSIHFLNECSSECPCVCA